LPTHTGPLLFVIDCPGEERELEPEGLSSQLEFYLFLRAYWFRGFANKWYGYFSSLYLAEKEYVVPFVNNFILQVFVKRILTHILHFISPCLLLSCSLVNLPC
jgi:hypothetical protein